MKRQSIRRCAAAAAVVVAPGWCMGTTAMASPPTPVNSTLGPLDGLCTFPVQLQQTGKGKEIDLAGGRKIFTSPGLVAVVTTLDQPSHKVTLNIPGTFHESTDAAKTVTTVVTGRNLLFDPFAGFVLAVGHFQFGFKASGELIPLAGQGQLSDICAMID